MAIQGTSVGQVQEFLQILKKRRWQVVLCTLYLAALGSVIATIMPRQWRAKTRLEVRQDEETEEYITNAEFFIPYYENLRDIVERQRWADYLQLDDLARHEYLERLVEDLEIVVVLGRAQDKRDAELTAFVDVAYVGTDRDQASSFLNEVVEAWQKDVMDRRSLIAQRAVSQHQDARQEATRQVADIVRRETELRGRLKLDWTLDGKEQESDPELVRLEASRTQLETTEVEHLSLQKEIESLEALWRLEPVEVKVEEPVVGTRDSELIAAIEKELEARQRELENYLPPHPRYGKLQEDIRRLEDKLREAEAEGTPDSIVETFVPNERRAELAGQIDERRARLDALALEMQILDERIREGDAEFQSRLASKSELVKLEQERKRWNTLETEAERAFYEADARLKRIELPEQNPFRTVQEALPPRRPEPPGPTVVVVIATLVGLALGVGSAFMSELGRNCFRTVHDFTQVMALPVLGVVNSIVTGYDVRRARLRRTTVALSSLLLIGGLSWFTWAWTARQDLLPTELVRYIESVRTYLRS